MKTNSLMSLCLSVFLAFSAPLSFAEKMQTKPGEMFKVLTDLKSKGYIIVKKIEFDDSNGVFIAKVVNGEGKNLELQVNPQTGQMAKPKNDITGWTAMEIAKKVQDAGYNNIYEINTEIFGNEFKVKVLNDKGEKVSIKVDAKTGSITKIAE